MKKKKKDINDRSVYRNERHQNKKKIKQQQQKRSEIVNQMARLSVIWTITPFIFFFVLLFVFVLYLFFVACIIWYGECFFFLTLECYIYLYPSYFTSVIDKVHQKNLCVKLSLYTNKIKKPETASVGVFFYFSRERERDQVKNISSKMIVPLLLFMVWPTEWNRNSMVECALAHAYGIS